jgi:AICAR transformylase/IMP cyclohydrolase PurH
VLGPKGCEHISSNYTHRSKVTCSQSGNKRASALLAELERHGGMTPLALRRALAAKAYARTADYDAAIPPVDQIDTNSKPSNVLHQLAAAAFEFS